MLSCFNNPIDERGVAEDEVQVDVDGAPIDKEFEKFVEADGEVET